MGIGFSDNCQAVFGSYVAEHFKGMLNKPLKKITLTPDKETIIFEFLDDSYQSFGVEGDCCSHSWIEHLEVPPKIKGAKILNVKESSIDDTREAENDYECIQVYHTTFITNKGEIVLEYRNSSNGYYGGYLVAK